MRISDWSSDVCSSDLANLRSHRKILVIDGCITFTGGMNIREKFVYAVAGLDTCSDTHFKVEGPVVLQLMSVYAHDWEFTTKENLPFDAWCCNTWNAPMPQDRKSTRLNSSH